MTDDLVATRPAESRRRTADRSPWVRRALLAVAGVLILIGLWQATVVVNHLSAIVLPAPATVAGELGTMLRDGYFWHNVGTSVVEFVCGFGIGVGVGIVVGLAIDEFAVLHMTLNPVLEALRFVVPFAWIPLSILWFGTSFWGKVFLVSYAVFFVMVVSTAGMLRQVDPTLRSVGTMLGMGRARLAFTVRLRAAAPGVASASRAAAAIGWIAVIAAEYVGSSAGIGFIVINAEQTLQTEAVIAGVIVVGFVGAAVSAVISWVSNRWLKYT